jgi:hypothetical protein
MDVTVRVQEPEHGAELSERAAEPLLREARVDGEARGARVERRIGREAPRADRALRRGASVGVAAHPRVERSAVDELHREEPLVADGEQLEEERQVRVRQIGESAELRPEAIAPTSVEALQRLEGDAEAALSIVRLVDDAEASFAERAGDLESLRRDRALRREALCVMRVAHRCSITRLRLVAAVASTRRMLVVGAPAPADSRASSSRS